MSEHDVIAILREIREMRDKRALAYFIFLEIELLMLLVLSVRWSGRCVLQEV